MLLLIRALQSLIDLAGSEKATSDKDQMREGKHTTPACSHSALSSVPSPRTRQRPSVRLIFQLTNSHVRSDHIPYCNSKVARMLQPSLSGNTRISVICAGLGGFLWER